MTDGQQALVALLGLLLGLFGAGILTSNRLMQRYFQPQLLRKAVTPLTVSPIAFKPFTGDTP
jgi:sigma-E factor negative regulatory protein RseC